MKCPYCNGETYGKFCEYCGSELPSPASAPDPVPSHSAPDPARPQRTSRLAENTGSKRHSTDCPKCGSGNILFEKHRFGKMTRAGAYIHRSATQEKIGICKNCGHTWKPGYERRSNVSLWVWALGWVLMFPIPAMILLNRGKHIPRLIRILLILLMWLIYFAMIMSAYLPE